MSSDYHQLCPFKKIGTFIKENNLLPEGANLAPRGSELSSLKECPYGLEFQYRNIKLFPLNVYNFSYAI